jgi:hypothetical protein
MKPLLMLVFVVMLSGCQHQAPRVACDRHLAPINTTTSVAKEPEAARVPTP